MQSAFLGTLLGFEDIQCEMHHFWGKSRAKIGAAALLPLAAAAGAFSGAAALPGNARVFEP